MTGKSESRPDDGPVGWTDILTRRHGPALALVCLGVWLHAANGLLVATMLPALVAEIGGQPLVGWTISLYEIGTILTGAASGLLATRHGVRLPMSVAAAVFAVGCAISALAPAMWVVLTGRLLQGLGGGGLMALSFVATGVLFPKPLIPRAIAAMSALWGVSAFLGPLIGGLFVTHADWRSGFWFFAVQALALSLWIALARNVRERPADDDKTGRVFTPRLALLTAGVVLIAYGGVEVGPLRTALFVLAGIAAIIGFLVLDTRSDAARLLPRRPLGFGTPVGSALAMILCMAIATVAMSAYGPLLMVMLHGASAMAAGYIIACASIGWTIAAVLVSGSPARHDLKFILAGMLLVGASIAGFVHAVPTGPLWLIAVLSALEGVGFGLAWGFILRQMTALAPADETERVAGAIPTIQRLGYAIGAAYIGIVANAAGFTDASARDAIADTARAIFLFCLPFIAVGLAATARFVFLGARGRPIADTRRSSGAPNNPND